MAESIEDGSTPIDEILGLFSDDVVLWWMWFDVGWNWSTEIIF